MMPQYSRLLDGAFGAAVIFVAVAFVTPAVATPISSASDAVVWGACPPVGGGGANECATIPLPLDPSNPASPLISIFVRRYFAGAAATSKSLWMVEGGPGYSSVAFAPIAEYVVGLDASVTVYLMDQRGTGQSAPINCATPPTALWFDPYNATILAQFAACNQEIGTKYADVAAFYSTYNAAQDMVAAINLINPEKVAIYALSYGTYFTNTYLQLPGARADVVVMDGPVPADRWALENNAPWIGVVAQDIFTLCARLSASCADHLGAMGQLPRYVMDSIIDGTLPCLASLPWLNQHVAATYAASLTLNGAAHALHGPFWWRLLRCTDSDVQQLNAFHAYKTATDVAPAAPSYSYALAVVIGSSEVYSFAGAPGGSEGLTYAQQVNFTARQFADASPQLVLSLAREPAGNGGGVPRYAPNPATYRKIAKPTVPVVVMVGTLDPNTPHGLGPWLAAGLGSRATLVTIPYSAHGTVAYNAPCAVSIAFNFLLAYGAQEKPDTSCLSSISPPDFDGLLPETQALANTYFGTPNVWNDAVPIPPFPAATCTAPAEGSMTGYIAAICVLAVSTIVFAGTSLHYRRKIGAHAAGSAGADYFGLEHA